MSFSVPTFLDRKISLYEHLGVENDASPNKIRENYITALRNLNSKQKDNPFSTVIQQEKDIKKYAYTILDDPHMKHIYDKYGYKGLDEGLPLDKTKIKKSFANIITKGNMGFNKQLIQTTDIKLSFKNFQYYRELQTKITHNIYYNVKNIIGKISISFLPPYSNRPLEIRVSKSLSYNIRDNLSILLSYSNHTKSHFKTIVYYGIYTHIFGSGFIYSLKNGLAPLFEYRSQLTQSCGLLTKLKLGSNPSFSCGINRNAKNSTEYSIKVKTNPKDDLLSTSASISYPVLSTLRLIASINSKHLSLGLLKQYNNLALGFKISLGIFSDPQTVDIFLYAIYFNNKLTIPILPWLVYPSSTEELFKILLYPFLSFVLYSESIGLFSSAFDIYNRYKLKQEYNNNYNDFVLNAQNENKLIGDTIQRQIQKEKENNGIVIQEAWYGDITNPQLNVDHPNVINVTTTIQFMVKNSSLNFPTKTSKSKLDGFYDPCFGKKKYLWIDYIHNGIQHCAIIEEYEPFSLPKIAHTTLLDKRLNCFKRDKVF